jgi:DNA-binding XRE family transcriptional regulator
VDSPRDWLIEPVYFAKGTRRWKPANTDADLAQRRAARWQEHLVYRLKSAIAEAGLTQASLAQSVGLSADTVSRIVTGTSWMELRHVALFEQELNVDLMDGTRPELDGPLRS